MTLLTEAASLTEEQKKRLLERSVASPGKPAW
jgi:hypothetical protein